MTAFYTNAEYRYLQEKEAQRGESIDLVVCSDGIMRTSEEKIAFDEINKRPCKPVERKLIG